MVLERLIEAMETDQALPVRIGPKAFGSAMPEYFHSERETWAMEVHDQIFDGGRHFKRVRSDRRKEIERRAKTTRERITRMEEAFQWVIDFVPSDGRRKCLLSYAMVKARGWEWQRYISNRNRKNPDKIQWKKRTCHDWNSKSLQEIETKLLNSEILLREDGYLRSAQIGAEQTGKSITSDLHAWMAADAKPRDHPEMRIPAPRKE
ncbi:hypothetical protein C5748_25800 [Phyllobacterium phragmitis]|uniref:Uncharacterized protein n=2 Tax=Phyllobacterium phragmitis TaxID=2670329 RepID=A0A2S9IJH3_9HYPH|nr:hypothetical protein C5748_25800 [Phyllobacterium phragmitis]